MNVSEEYGKWDGEIPKKNFISWQLCLVSLCCLEYLISFLWQVHLNFSVLKCHYLFIRLTYAFFKNFRKYCQCKYKWYQFHKSVHSENVICYCLWVDGKILKHLKKTGGKNWTFKDDWCSDCEIKLFIFFGDYLFSPFYTFYCLFSQCKSSIITLY